MYPINKGEFPKVIDSTIRSDFVACPTKFFWSFQRKLGGTEPSIDLIAGGAFAHGLEIIRKAYYGEEKLPLDKALQRGMLAAIEHYGDVICPDHKQNKSVERVVMALDAYFTEYPPQSDYIQPYFPDGVTPSVEFTFALPLPIMHPVSGEPILYAGRFDLLGFYKSQLIVVDEKTTSQLGPTWPNKWNLRGQFTGYIYACHSFKLPVVGAIARGVSFLKNSFGFAESIQMRAPWQLEMWYEQLLKDVQRMVVCWETGWYDQALDEACAGFSGCPFQTLCTTPEPENWIAGRYGIREWDPLQKTPASQPKQHIEIIALPDELKALMGDQPCQ